MREWLALVLLAALPFHALGVTVLTRLIDGPNQPPMGFLALWKEALLVVILLFAIIEIIRCYPLPATRSSLRLDRFDVCILVLASALGVATLLNSVSLMQAIYGIRYDLVPLIAFLVLRRVSWSDWFKAKAPIVLAAVAGIAAIYALTTLLLPEGFFRMLGYSDLHSLYVPGRPIAAFQQIGGTGLRRLQGAMSGPNQFGIWLAMLLPILLALPVRTRRFIAPLALFAIALSFSRAAWIAAAVIVFIHFWPTIRTLHARTVAIACTGILAIIVSAMVFFPSVILRIESSADHLRNPFEALSIMATSPFGRGLGSAGPANNRVADACVFVEEGSDVSWAAPHADLCVFAGNTQLQPTGTQCDCPLLPENWYLQLDRKSVV